MTSVDFCYWLQGFFELSESEKLTEKQIEIIKNHLKLVFFYEIDPSYSSDPVVQETLQNLHDGNTIPVKPNRVNPDRIPGSSVVVKC